MKEYETQLQELLRIISSFEDIPLCDIPSIDLYMDQVTTFMEERLKCFKRDYEDKILTKTMINNYAKSHILPPPKKKKYSKRHMILLILVYHLKSVLSISDIHALLGPILEDFDSTGTNQVPIEEIYNRFLCIQKNEYDILESDTLQKVKEIQNEMVVEEHLKDQWTLLLTILMLVTQATAQKRLAEKLIDEFYSEKVKK